MNFIGDTENGLERKQDKFQIDWNNELETKDQWAAHTCLSPTQFCFLSSQHF